MAASSSPTSRPSPDEPERRYPLAETTFALHTVPPEQRSAVLAALRPRVGVPVIAEFDDPAPDHAGPDHLRLLAETYERGIAEYGDDRELVAQGFLMPLCDYWSAPAFLLTARGGLTDT